MEVQQDFNELLKLLNEHNVKYLIVGGYALAFHGAPRFTGDIDIYVKPDSENAQHVMSALKDFGFGQTGLTEEDFLKPDKVIQLGVPPVRVDIITSISGVTWKEAYSGAVDGKYGSIAVKYIGVDEFIKNKQKTARKKDIADIEALRRK